jgi:AraC family transcriptional regulator
LIIDRIAESMTDSISVDELAQCVGLSVSHLMQGFKSAFGTTPWQYVLSTRLDEAASLLATTGETVGQIASSTGFASPSHLATAFGRQFGVSPMVYRRQCGSRVVNAR